MSTDPNKNNSLPSPVDFFLKTPLYEVFQADAVDEFQIQDVKIQDVKNFQGTIDAFCIDCEKPSIFRRIEINQEEYEDYPSTSHDSKVFCIPFVCTRDKSHNMYFYFMAHNYTVRKIGQYPSLADLNSDKIKKYRKILGDKYKEFSKAVGLVSHGVGIGSFVYLRRIFEDLVEEAHQKATEKDAWDEEKYKKARMEEKIGLLKENLPNFLVEHKTIYSILSKGIHELSEDECLEYFYVVKSGIEFILDEKLEKINRDAKLKEVEKSLSEINSKHK
jgi:hypothetical protein